MLTAKTGSLVKVLGNSSTKINFYSILFGQKKIFGAHFDWSILSCRHVSSFSSMLSNQNLAGSSSSTILLANGQSHDSNLCNISAAPFSTKTSSSSVVNGTGVSKSADDGTKTAAEKPYVKKTKFILNEGNINPCIKQMEYAVRGPIVIRACELENQLILKKSQQNKSADQEKIADFEEIIKTNIGDAQAMGQTPITFFRQMLALLSYPELLKNGDLRRHFPADVIWKAERILDACPGRSLGSYSASAGIEVIRRDVATFINARDVHVTDPSRAVTADDIFLSSGASEAIRNVLCMFKHPSLSAVFSQKSADLHPHRRTGVMIPIPQYPLYSATLSEYEMEQVGYYLNEERNWSLDVTELERAYASADSKTCDIRVLVVINPGNPTGQVLSPQNMKEIVEFAHKYSLFLFCDEVYQQNIYESGVQWHSFREVVCGDLGLGISPQLTNEIEMASFYSASKGYMGECGLRGGYCHFYNLDPAVRNLYIKMISARLCPTTLGQALMDAIVNFPKPGDASFEQFEKEKNAILVSLGVRANQVASRLNAIPGITCNRVSGAMYAFPRITIPPRAIETAVSKGVEPDFLFAMELLESEGLCVVPGSGFGQVPGTYHFRMTILPPEAKMAEFLDRFSRFYEKFCQKYKS